MLHATADQYSRSKVKCLDVNNNFPTFSILPVTHYSCATVPLYGPDCYYALFFDRVYTVNRKHF